MKKLFFLLLTTFTLSCCNNDDNDSSDTLPPETQTGANTAGCLVNGKVFLPKKQGINPELICNYEFIDGEYFFNLRIVQYVGADLKAIVVQNSKISLDINQPYILNKNKIEPVGCN